MVVTTEIISMVTLKSINYILSQILTFKCCFHDPDVFDFHVLVNFTLSTTSIPFTQLQSYITLTNRQIKKK